MQHKAVLLPAGFGPSWEMRQLVAGKEAPLQPSSGPALLPGPALSCPSTATPRSIFALASSSSLWLPLQHPFTTSFDMLLPPAVQVPASASPPRD